MFSSNATQVSSANYIEDVFSTYLYDGTNATLSINNGVDLSTYGGLTFIKYRNLSDQWYWFDTARGANKSLASNTTAAQVTRTNYLNSFNTNGFTVGSNLSTSGYNIASWTFRKQPKFFDVVTYTGNGANRNISHNLGSAPGCIIIKCTSTGSQWVIWHRSGTQLNNYCAYFTTGGYIDQGTSTWGTNGGVPSMTSTTFSLGSDSEVNTSGATYVAYLFAHDAGGFGLTGTDNVISCGSYTGSLSVTPVVTLGYEPQFVMVKKIDATGNWQMMDSMSCGYTSANLTNAQAGAGSWMNVGGNNFVPTATGFSVNTSSSDWNSSGGTYIYIAIRRGPMKVPTSGTSVFEPVAITGDSTSRVVTNSAGFPIDAALIGVRSSPDNKILGPRLTGQPHLLTNDTAIETTNDFQSNPYAYMNGIYVNGTGGTNQSGNTYVYEMFRRAPSFFDVVCYTGTGTAGQTFNHNLSVAPELMIVKARNGVLNWKTYDATTGATKNMNLNLDTASAASSTNWNNTAPTASVFTVGTSTAVNGSGTTYVAYLFATCAGVSKVGSYTGTGALQTVNCGFTSGARFVLIKRTDSTGDWWTYDSARGITSGNDPYLFLNSTAAEVTSTNYVDTDTTGFKVTAAAPAGLNASGGTYIFLAIA